MTDKPECTWGFVIEESTDVPVDEVHFVDRGQMVGKIVNCTGGKTLEDEG